MGSWTPPRIDQRVLVVDDESIIQRTLSRVLSKGGYSATVAGDAQEARRCLEHEEFALVLCDVNMPGESGIDLVRHIFKNHPDTATVMVSAEDNTNLAALALESGAYGYVLKPFGPSEILINVYNALRRRGLEIERRGQQEALERTVQARTAELREAVIKLQVADSELRQSQEETIQRLAKAAEFRDVETGDHIKRMSQYCALLARKYGLSESECELIRVASPMHDVGKLGIPDRILLKPGKLTREEYAVMQKHTEIGYRILSGSGAELLDLAAIIALTHHERFDGTGYPRGIAGEDIPLEGRIAAVADVFDALTSRRIYKIAYSVEESVGIIKDGRSSRHDPAIVDLFLDAMDEVLAIKRRNPDRPTPVETEVVR